VGTAVLRRNEDVAKLLLDIGELLALRGDNPFRVRAYEEAARSIAGMSGDVGDRLARPATGRYSACRAGAHSKDQRISQNRALEVLRASPYGKSNAEALKPLTALLRGLHADIDVLHVVGPTILAPREPGSLSVTRYMDEPQHAVPRWTSEFLARFCSNLGRPPECMLVAVGDPGEEIIRTARERESDLIVLAWKGNMNGYRARVVRSLLRESPCPILFVRIRPSSKS
jgi:nucleotide-binding universal stress UspA family protein